MTDETFRVLTVSEIMREAAPVWPRCECGGWAEIVCASPRWEPEGFTGHGTDERAVFCCRKHPDATGNWYWFWIIDAAQRDDDAPTLWSRDMMTHVAAKTWGPPFLAWLLGEFDLSPETERMAFGWEVRA
ncbi:MAG TPA: hypothetical protein VM285_05705 [Polyangia bacterium]|nr:hypothetical protein [Polyangia bacterium]